MTKVKTFLVTVALASLLTPAALGQGQALDGFRGIPWGAEIDRVPGMKRNGQMSPDFVWYKREGDKLQFGDAELFSVSYLAYKGRLFRVDLEAIGQNEKKLADAAIATFGQMGNINDPKSLGHLWPRNLQGPITGTAMRGAMADKTIIALVEGHVYEAVGQRVSMTVLGFTDATTAQALQANPPKAAPARPGDF